MPGHPAFVLNQISGRSIVRLRVRPGGADNAATALKLPLKALLWRGGDPTACWLGPDQWLLTSDLRSATDIIEDIGAALGDQLHAATDMSSQNVCLSLQGRASRTILAMGCGIDMHQSTFKKGECIRTHFANVALFMVVVGDNEFDLYVDRSYAQYLQDWIVNAGEDPITCESRHNEVTAS
jgi:sarcosine oxidase subunit gamma